MSGQKYLDVFRVVDRRIEKKSEIDMTLITGPNDNDWESRIEKKEAETHLINECRSENTVILERAAIELMKICIRSEHQEVSIA